MAKKKQKTEEEAEETVVENTKKKVEEEMTEEKYALIDLVSGCPYESTWIIYNLSRKGLLEQYEQEIKDKGIREIPPSFTITEFDKIMNGEL